MGQEHCSTEVAIIPDSDFLFPTVDNDILDNL